MPFSYADPCLPSNTKHVQGYRNVTKSEEASETSISSRAKTNPSRKYFFADMYRPRPDESFSVQRLRLRKKGKNLKIILAEK